MIGRFAEKLATRSQIRIRSHLCVRVRYPRASCRLCQDVCPFNAVQTESEQVNLDRSCAACGACVTACPAGVFEIPARFQRARHQRIRQTMQTDPVVRFTCLRDSDSHRQDVSVVPCVAGLSHGELIAPLAWGADKVEVKTPPCNHCDMKQARRQYERTVQEVHALLASFQISPGRLEQVEKFDETVLTETESSGSGCGGLDRREFFRLIRRRGVNRVLEAMPDAEASLETDRWGHREKGERSFLLGLLSRLGPPAEEALSCQTLPIRDLIIESHCVGCNICETLCPTGAIRRAVEEDGTMKLLFTAARCTGCDVCGEACPSGAIDYGESIDWDELIGAKERVLVHVRSRPCRLCREGFSGLPGSICPACLASRRNGMV